MNKNHLPFNPSRLRWGGMRLMQASILALILALALPAMAGEARAIKSRVAPVYPEIAKRMKITGVVRLEATVDASGKVTNVKTVSGSKLLSTAAEDAVHKWKFEPGPETTVVAVSLNFAL